MKVFVILYILNLSYLFNFYVVCVYFFYLKKKMFLKMNYFYKNYMWNYR